ncbi:MAG: hypothetical protein SCH71_02985 [Desulfobulbaceae bacterium]|nr:hypothetical protein [Desulfobulbaceae bacterium]
MNHLQYKITVVLFLVLFCAANSWGVDYSLFNNQELFDLRGAVGNADAAEQEAYRQEWGKRLEKMSEEEKEKYTAAAEDAAGDGEGKVPVVIQGRGYDQGAGTIIYGGAPAGGSGQKSGGR